MPDLSSQVGNLPGAQDRPFCLGVNHCGTGGSGYTVIQSGLKTQKCPIVPDWPSMGIQAYSAKQGGLAMSCLLHPPQPHLDLACLAWPQLTSPQYCSPEAGNWSVCGRALGCRAAGDTGQHR